MSAGAMPFKSRVERFLVEPHGLGFSARGEACTLRRFARPHELHERRPRHDSLNPGAPSWSTGSGQVKVASWTESLPAHGDHAKRPWPGFCSAL